MVSLFPYPYEDCLVLCWLDLCVIVYSSYVHMCVSPCLCVCSWLYMNTMYICKIRCHKPTSDSVPQELSTWVCVSVCVYIHIYWCEHEHAIVHLQRSEDSLGYQSSLSILFEAQSLCYYFFHHVHQATSSRNFQVMYTRLPLLPLLIISRALLSLPHISSYEYLYTCALPWVFMVVFQDWHSSPHTCTVKLHPQTLLSSPTLVLEAGSLTAV